MKHVSLQVEGMSCGHCVKAIEQAVKEVGASAAVDLNKKSVSVEFDESKVTLESIKDAIEDQGYDVV